MLSMPGCFPLESSFLAAWVAEELAFQIIAIYAFDNVLNRPIYSALQKQWILQIIFWINYKQ